MPASVSKGDRIEQQKLFAGAGVSARPHGDLLFVDATNGSNGNSGLYRHAPLATLARALELAVAGDTILLAPGGSETLTAALAVSQSYLKIVCDHGGLGSRYALTAAGTLALLSVSGAGVEIEGIKMAHTGATANSDCITASAAADGLTVRKCTFDDSAIATTFTGTGVYLTDGVTDYTVEDCDFLDIKFGVRGVLATGTHQLRPKIKRNRFFVGKSAAFGIHYAVSGTGTVKGFEITGNHFYEANGDGTSATTAWDGTSGANATQGPILLPAAADQGLIADNIAYTVSAYSFDNLNNINAGAATVKSNNRATAALGDLSTLTASVATLTAGSATGVGSRFYVYKSVTKTTIVTGGVDLTGVSAGGLIEIEAALFQNDSTNFGGATLLELYTNNVEGLNSFFSTAIATLDSGGVVQGAKRVVLESGKKVLARATGSNATGAGTVGVYLICKRLTAGASLAAA